MSPSRAGGSPRAWRSAAGTRARDYKDEIEAVGRELRVDIPLFYAEGHR